MGRSRPVARATSEEANQSRPKRKKPTTSSGNVEAHATSGHDLGEEATIEEECYYCCNYCGKDLSGMIRMKCALCLNFDLCVECFSVGAELYPHKSNHPYQVMDNLSFPLLCPDWNADEEMLLLEAIAVYGFGNWAGVAEHVGTKTKSQCIDHYNGVYMNSPCFPLPDISHVKNKSRKELLIMAKEREARKESHKHGGLSVKEEQLCANAKNQVPIAEDPTHQFSSSLAGDIGSPLASKGENAVKKNSNVSQRMDENKLAEQQPDRSIGEKKPRMSGEVAPSATELHGYNFKRQEFEVEYDNDAEQLLADMEFRDTDTEYERELKLKVLHIYSRRLDERKRRRDFILERDLLHPDAFEMSLSLEEKQIYQRYKVFMRFHSKEEHRQLLDSVINEHRIVKRIQVLQEGRAAGCRTGAELNRFIEEKRKKEAEDIAAQRFKESGSASLAGKALKSPRGSIKGVQTLGKETSSTLQDMSSSFDHWDISGFVGADMLSENEKLLCCEIRILPAHYLKMLQTLSVEIMKGKVKHKSDAYGLFKVDPSKVDRIYDMLVKKGIAQA